MIKKISHLFINDLISKIDIIDLINSRISLKKQGKNFSTCCPFHHEKNPSFVVNREKQFYYCFGCGVHGNIIDFVMKYDRLEFVEAVKELSYQYGLTILYVAYNNKNHQSNSQEYSDRHGLYQLMNQLCLFYHNMLYTKFSISARYYLKQRGLNQSILNRFLIGFSPNYNNNIDKYHNIEKDGYYLLSKAGILTINNDNNYVCDRFRNRIIFPIRDKYGRVIAFGGRVINNAHPKYINSVDTTIFNKGSHVYGLYEARQHNSNLVKLLIVEGYIDVLSLSQFGITYVVASLGTAISENHIRLLYHNTDQIICCYDGDQAGKLAAWRTLKNALPFLGDNKQLKFMFLPEGEDPDTLIRKIGKEKFEILINQSIESSTYLLDKLFSQVDLSERFGKIKLISLSIPLINMITNHALRFCLRQQLGVRLGIFDDNQLSVLFKENKKKKVFLFCKKLKYTKMRVLIGLLIQYPKLYINVPILHGLDKVFLPGLSLFIELINTCRMYQCNSTGQLLEHYRHNKFYCYLEILSVWNHMITESAIEETFIDTLKSLYDHFLEDFQNILIAKDRMHGLTSLERQELWSLSNVLAKI